MNIIQQLTPFTCGLACLESIAADFPPPVTQAEMLQKYKKDLIGDVLDYGDFGAASGPMLKRIWLAEGFRGGWQKDHRKDAVRDVLLKKLSNKQALLITCNYEKNGWHCIRYSGLKDDDSIFAMVPDFYAGTVVKEISIQNLIAWDYEFAVLER